MTPKSQPSDVEVRTVSNILYSALGFLRPRLIFFSPTGSFSPHIVVLTAYSLAVAGYYPKELVKYIFNIDFLGKLDTMSESELLSIFFPFYTVHENNLVRHRLMHLNRAVCLECAEYQVPWFHDQYCQQVQRKVSIKNSVQHQIHQMLGEIFGGHNYVKISVMTPYYYSIGKRVEIILHLRSLQYSSVTSIGMTPEPRNDDPGILEFLDSKAFCRNSSCVLGEYVMKKRHLEMLGYHVVQISSLEWNSMELSSKDAWKEYLQKSIFEDST
uniref:RAP domain-containing protein n=1 Tax=Leptobrachium leishanense TaxID=445787 RepID=A0A8C5RAM9_9ANUR